MAKTRSNDTFKASVDAFDLVGMTKAETPIIYDVAEDNTNIELHLEQSFIDKVNGGAKLYSHGFSVGQKYHGSNKQLDLLKLSSIKIEWIDTTESYKNADIKTIFNTIRARFDLKLTVNPYQEYNYLDINISNFTTGDVGNFIQVANVSYIDNTTKEITCVKGSTNIKIIESDVNIYKWDSNAI